MEVKKISNDFAPIKLELTIETLKELITLRRMCRLNVSIPDLFEDKQELEIIHDFLGSIQDVIGMM